MQTFLPYADYAASATALDDRRLGKQRVEVLQVLRALVRPTYGWKNHPATRMWRGHEVALAEYGVAICREWQRRGYADTCEVKILDELAESGRPDTGPPVWLGDERVHASHRAALVAKQPDWYRERFGELPELPYFWPVAKENADVRQDRGDDR